MRLSSTILQNAVDSVSSLPGIGRKSALRLVLHLLNEDQSKTDRITNSLIDLKSKIKYCQNCYNFSDELICNICNDPARNKKLVCVVESVRDVMAIEETQQFSGVYHILGGVISPLEGIGPEDINIQSLIDKIQREEVFEIILAISPTIEGDTTAFYLSKKMSSYNVSISKIARGVSFGSELQYADEFTLGRSILSRVPYNSKSE